MEDTSLHPFADGVDAAVNGSEARGTARHGHILWRDVAHYRKNVAAE